jgi:hypothetical protein
MSIESLVLTRFGEQTEQFRKAGRRQPRECQCKANARRSELMALGRVGTKFAIAFTLARVLNQRSVQTRRTRIHRPHYGQTGRELCAGGNYSPDGSGWTGTTGKGTLTSRLEALHD